MASGPGPTCSDTRHQMYFLVHVCLVCPFYARRGAPSERSWDQWEFPAVRQRPGAGCSLPQGRSVPARRVRPNPFFFHLSRLSLSPKGTSPLPVSPQTSSHNPCVSSTLRHHTPVLPTVRIWGAPHLSHRPSNAKNSARPQGPDDVSGGQNPSTSRIRVRYQNLAFPSRAPGSPIQQLVLARRKVQIRALCVCVCVCV